ncbi:HAD-IIA family hydrolase [Enemella sp. A6]|uniref:HAD-IIA family hydrolase n=1 Tax=Enemella sp. A6 TaxID=3440152 RepID=UPI003EBA2E06
MIEAFDAVLFDLDGVIYLGPQPVAGAAEGVRGLRDRKIAIGFVTNNAARSPREVAEHLTALGVAATETDVVTSSQAGARLLAEQVPAGSKVLIIGTEALAEQVALVGLEPVHDLTEMPAAVIQGYHPNLYWPLLEEACVAIQHGAVWVATNTDSTRPTERGIVPGNGAAVAAVRTAVDVDPLVAGKPHRPLIDEAVRRTGASNALFVGDRLDTDIEGAHAVGLASAMVLTGAHGVRDLLAAHPGARPTMLLVDLPEMFEPARVAEPIEGGFRCRAAEARVLEGTLRVVGPEDTPARAADAAWAAANACWAAADAGIAVDRNGWGADR